MYTCILQAGTSMVAQSSLTVIVILMNIQYGGGENLWCFECNTDLRSGHTRECNDPYTPTPYFDLMLCPQNESQHCLKSVIDYKDVLVTIRGCVPSREIDGYCQHEKYFPDASVTCSFCNDYACNRQESFYSHNLIFYLFSTCILTYFR